MSPLRIRIADISEHASLNARYLAWGYRGGVEPGDALYIAELNGEAVGLVRRATSDGATMLRGCYVDPAHQGEGVGSAMLAAFVRDLGDVECYCVPFTHLTHFYAKGGFVVLSDDEAPAFLALRLRGYRAEGRDVLIMRRGQV